MVSFLKLHMSVYLRAKFEVSSIIRTSFRHRGGGWKSWGGGEDFSPPPPQNESLKIQATLGLKKLKENWLKIT